LPATDAPSKRTHEVEAAESPRKVGRFNWADPAVPAGDAPPNVPRWPVAVALALWIGWVVFLVLMVMQRIADQSA
jgi:hypothetical protein